MDGKLTRENLRELDVAARQLDFYPVPPKDSALKLVEKLSEIKDVPLEVDDAKVAKLALPLGTCRLLRCAYLVRAGREQKD